MTDAIVVLCNCPAETSTRRIASILVQEKLAACVNLLPTVTSIYIWQGNTEESQEIQLVMKSRRTLFHVLEQRVAELHPYEVPEIIALPILCGNASYLHWLQEQTSP